MTSKTKELYRYSFDGKTFIAYATSPSNFRDIMNRNSQWGRYSLSHMKGYTGVIELRGLQALVVNEMLHEGFEGVWLHKFIADENFKKLFEVSNLSGEYFLIRRDEYDKLMSSDTNKLSDRLAKYKVIILKIRDILKENDVNEAE